MPKLFISHLECPPDAFISPRLRFRIDDRCTFLSAPPVPRGLLFVFS
jgi:hypothetical protein